MASLCKDTNLSTVHGSGRSVEPFSNIWRTPQACLAYELVTATHPLERAPETREMGHDLGPMSDKFLLADSGILHQMSCECLTSATFQWIFARFAYTLNRTSPNFTAANASVKA